MNSTSRTEELQSVPLHVMKLDKIEAEGNWEGEAITKSEAEIKAILENTPDVIFQLSPHGIIQYVSPTVREIYGYEPEDLIGRHLSTTTPESDLQKASEALVKVFSGEAIRGLEIGQLHANGAVVPTEINCVPIRKDGRINAVQGIMRDISERKWAEKEIRIKESAIASSINAIAMADLDGSLTYVNQSFLKMWGFDDEKEALGTSAVGFWQTEEKALEVIKALMNRGSWIGELIAKRKDGSPFDAQLSASVSLDYGGKPVCLMASFVDITERKLAEDKLRELYERERKQREELEEERRMRGQFMNALAHELRTPLTPLITSVELLKDVRTSDPMSPEYRLLDLIFGGAKRLAKRLDELLDMARFAVGIFLIDPRPIDIRPLLENTILQHRESINARKQSIILDAPETLPSVEADSDCLEQVLTNLVSNASKFSAEGGRITLVARAEVGELVIAVKDEGIGLSEEEQEMVFKPYHQVEQDQQRCAGLGLGLAISKQIVEVHKGRIWIESQLGGGSTFKFSLPLRETKDDRSRETNSLALAE